MHDGSLGEFARLMPILCQCGDGSRVSTVMGAFMLVVGALLTIVLVGARHAIGVLHVVCISDCVCLSTAH